MACNSKDNMNSRHTKYSLIIMALLLSGCNLPLCNDGEVICTYGLLENCASDNAEDCACDPYTDANCIHASTRRQYLAKCQLNICKNNTFQSDSPCNYGFDGEKCMTECNPGEIKCTDNDGNDVQMYDEIQCQLRTCETTGQWSKKSETCQIGYNGRTCIPECLSGNTKCVDSSGKEIEPYLSQFCLLSTCGADGYYQQTPQNCLYGFDGKNCLPECNNAETRCINAAGIAVEPNTSHESCDLKRCTEHKWPETYEKTCKFGFNGSDCINPCTIDDNNYDYLAGTLNGSTITYK